MEPPEYWMSPQFQFFLGFSLLKRPGKNKEAIPLSLSKPAHLFCVITVSLSGKLKVLCILRIKVDDFAAWQGYASSLSL